ncbi:MAG: hypothetical protein BWY61_01132 [Firmicutes bacterium ADurb.Bin354]|nr:MAG: hypothetical protein BWY61_01132 [Firmicutes bacterium ADurb.Bin354]
MYAEGSSDSRGGDKLLHEFRLIALKLCKLINNKDKMRQRNIRLSFPEEFDIVVDPIDVILCKELLSPKELRLYRYKGSVYLLTVDIGDSSIKMRKIPELICHSTALEVYDYKADLIGVKKSCHRQHIGLEQFRFTGACSSRNQTMRAMISFMKIKTQYASVTLNTYWCGHTLVNLRLLPSGGQIEIIGIHYSKQFVQSDVLGQSTLQTYLIHIYTSEAKRTHLRCLSVHMGIYKALNSSAILSFLNIASVILRFKVDLNVTIFIKHLLIFFEEYK